MCQVGTGHQQRVVVQDFQERRGGLLRIDLPKDHRHHLEILEHALQERDTGLLRNVPR